MKEVAILPYGVDLNKISIETYKDILKKQTLLPSRKSLQTDIDDIFKNIRRDGVHTLLDLKQALSTTGRMTSLSERLNIPMDYLTLLRREIGSFEPKSVRLAEFPEIPLDTLQAMRQHGLLTTKDFYDFCQENTDKSITSFKLALSMSEIEKLCCLSNLVRINGVGAIAARSFLEAGYKCVPSIAETTAEEMLARLTEVNNQKHYYKNPLGLKDMQYCIDYAKLIVGFEK